MAQSAAANANRNLWYNEPYRKGEQNMQEQKTFEEVVKPVMEWLAKNKHPHTIINIEATRAELLEGVECINADEYVQPQRPQ